MSTYRCQNCGHEFDAGLLFCGKCGAPNQTAQRIHQIEQMLQGLNPREREVIILRFGLESGHPLTLEEVGKRFKVTRERIRQIETAALRKLRNPSRSKKIRDFLP